jgi:hypothetical protein
MIRRTLRRVVEGVRHVTRHRLAKVALLAFVRGTSSALGAALVSLLLYWISR